MADTVPSPASPNANPTAPTDARSRLAQMKSKMVAAPNPAPIATVASPQISVPVVDIALPQSTQILPPSIQPLSPSSVQIPPPIPMDNPGFSVPVTQTAPPAVIPAFDFTGEITPVDYTNPTEVQAAPISSDFAIDNQYGDVYQAQNPYDASGNYTAPQTSVADRLRGLLNPSVIAGLVAVLFLIISLVGFFFALLPKFSKTTINQQQTSVFTSFDQCKNTKGEITTFGVTQICKQNNQISTASYSVEDYQKVLSEQEKVAAKNNQITYFSTQSADLQRFVVGSYYKTNSIPPGVVSYISKDKEKTGIQIVNNLFLNSPQAIQNDVYVDYVRKFLARDAQFTKTEPLGDESVVLQAFDVNEQRTKSRTVGELDSVQSGKLQKIRVLYGVDGTDTEKRAVTVRVFGIVRDNVILLQNSIPSATQTALESQYVAACKTQFKFKNDIQTCYIKSIGADPSLKTAAQDVAINLLRQYELQ